MKHPEDDIRDVAADVQADLAADDRALWRLLGVLEGEAVDAPSGFVGRVLGATGATPPLRRRAPVLGWAAGIAAAAAAAIVATSFWLPADERPTPATDSAAAADSRELVELLNDLSPADLLALDVADAEVHDAEWFGG